MTAARINKKVWSGGALKQSSNHWSRKSLYLSCWMWWLASRVCSTFVVKTH